MSADLYQVGSSPYSYQVSRATIHNESEEAHIYIKCEAAPIHIKIVSMVRKYHNHKLQTNPWHREEEPHNTNETPGRKNKNHLHDNPLCDLCGMVEHAIHYFFHCRKFTIERQVFIDTVRGFQPLSIDMILCGNFNLNMENNIVLFRAVHRYIHATFLETYFVYR